MTFPDTIREEAWQLYLEGSGPAETLQRLRANHGESSPSLRTIKAWRAKWFPPESDPWYVGVELSDEDAALVLPVLAMLIQADGPWPSRAQARAVASVRRMVPKASLWDSWDLANRRLSKLETDEDLTILMAMEARE